MKLVIETQVYENYGAHGWDGTGACPQYWKAKGGDEYVFPLAGTTIDASFPGLVAQASAQCVSDDDYYRESVIGWYLLSDHEHTQSERNQLDYEGAIVSPSPVRSL